MVKLSTRLPDLPTLTAGLNAVLRESSSVRGRVTVLERQYALNASTLASEIVTCRLADGSERQLFCKYGNAPVPGRPKQRHDVAYEAAVYREVLQHFPAATPTLYGTYMDKARARAWLILEYLARATPLKETQRLTTAMRQAAGWIGQFHAAQEARLARSSLPFLCAYDCAYYRRWARRRYLLKGPLPQRYPWLRRVCQRYEEWIELLTPPVTVIHDEYWIDNLLLSDGEVCPIDWETAAFAAGEIDLASLTWGWDATVVRACEQAYRRARWPGGAPADFGPRLAAARLYLHFRWLGDGPEVNDEGRSPVSFTMLHEMAERLGIL